MAETSFGESCRRTSALSTDIRIADVDNVVFHGFFQIQEFKGPLII